jgi:hypothetical protein
VTSYDLQDLSGLVAIADDILRDAALPDVRPAIGRIAAMIAARQRQAIAR